MTAPLHAFMYSSLAAMPLPAGEVARILEKARTHNAAHDITGLLLYDGKHFCQYFEGPCADTDALMGRIAADDRHVDLRMVLTAEPIPARRYARFAMGYSEPGSAAAFPDFERMDNAAIEHWLLNERPALQAEAALALPQSA